ncbi:T-cell receptor-associated transmembrane adapter 1 isoform X2 [Aquarana catesbeiana]|uniref:T-cell receptor-associated transmembrane adapter 1 isoform X2 n=1 Tax=Aquarana catesbeiana TaxID=8400 RepID=UPI003CC9DF2A
MIILHQNWNAPNNHAHSPSLNKAKHHTVNECLLTNFTTIKMAEKEVRYYSQCTLSFDQQCNETNPIYGNLNQPVLDTTDECCYEPMAIAHTRNREEERLEAEEQTCYASLDLSPKRPRKKRRKKPKQISHQTVEDKPVSRNGQLLSRSSIYLNSEQLTAECQAEEDLIHDDPVRIYHLLRKTRDNVAIEDENQGDWPEKEIL